MHKLKVITSTTRPGRKGISVARWAVQRINTLNLFTTELVDLAEVGLPFLDESAHPRLKKYEHEHTKRWSSRIDEADAFIIVLAEYNYGFPAPIKNALDFLYHEWRMKPIGFVSYGGISGGMRATQMLKQVATAFNMLPLSESVAIPSFSRLIDEHGEFRAEAIQEKSLDSLTRELARYSQTMKQLREHE